jgi:gas vesicle protein
MAERDEFGAFLIGFIIGGLTGAAVSLLMAPQTGEETRDYLRERAIELRDKAAETAQTTYEQVGQTATDVRSRAGDIASRAKGSAEDLQHRGQVILEEQKAKISDRVQSLRKKGEEDLGPESM